MVFVKLSVSMVVTIGLLSHGFFQTEDDGVVVAAMVWGGGDTNHTGLVILDAKTLTEIGRAEFRTPGPVPKTLHGWFLSQP